MLFFSFLVSPLNLLAFAFRCKHYSIYTAICQEVFANFFMFV